METNFNLRIEQQENRLEITLSGNLTAENSEVFKERITSLLDKKNKEYRIIMRDVKLIDSSGISACMVFYGLVKNLKRELYFVNISEPVRKIFSIVGVDKVLNIVDS